MPLAARPQVGKDRPQTNLWHPRKDRFTFLYDPYMPRPLKTNAHRTFLAVSVP